MTFRLKMVLAGFGVLAAQSALAAPPPALTVEYAADRLVETPSGDMQGRVNATPAMQRNETRMGDMASVMILRMDKKVGWMLMPAQKMYQQLDLDQAGQQAGAVSPEQTELELVGQETVSGQSTNKYKFVTKDKSSGGFLWYTASGIPVKMDVLSKNGGKSERMTVTLTNITIGTQDPALFEVPSGYAKLPGGMAGMGMAALGNPPPQAAEAEAGEVAKPAGARDKVRGALRSLGGVLR